MMEPNVDPRGQVVVNPTNSNLISSVRWLRGTPPSSGAPLAQVLIPID